MSSPEGAEPGQWFFHAHGSECDPVCVLERLAKGTWEPALPDPSLDVERLDEAIRWSSDPHDAKAIADIYARLGAEKGTDR